MIFRYYPFESWIAIALLSFAIGAWKYSIRKKLPVDVVTIGLCIIIFISSVLSAVHFYKK